MYLYHIIQKYNQIWSIFEIVCFFILLFVLSGILMYYFKQKKIRFTQVAATIGLYVFLIFVLEATVFARTSVGKYRYHLLPFWSWVAVLSGKTEYIEQILLNCILILPVGLFFPFVFDHEIAWKKSLFTGLCISIFIETGQLILQRGFFEFDDMIHNSFGCMCGTIVGNWIWRQWKNKKI